MTLAQIEYNFNAKQCIKLSKEIEHLTTEFYYQKNARDHEPMEIFEQQLREKKVQLSHLWNRQVDLFFEIREEAKRLLKLQHDEV